MKGGETVASSYNIARRFRVAFRHPIIPTILVVVATSQLSLALVGAPPVGDTCGNPFEIVSDSSGVIEANFGDYNDDYSSLCATYRIGPDIVFYVSVSSSDTLSFTFENLGATASPYQLWMVVDCFFAYTQATALDILASRRHGILRPQRSLTI
jgi:hypothetical protein